MSGEVTDLELGQATQRFAQTSAFNARERIICSHLIESINSEPLLGIIHVTMAALLCPETVSQTLKIDREEVIKLYNSAQILNSHSKRDKIINSSSGGGDFGDSMVSVNFATSDYGFIRKWATMSWYSYMAKPDGGEPKMSDYKKFIFTCGRLSMSGFSHMVSDFMVYAMPRSQDIASKLCEVVSPQIYQEMFKTITEGREVG